MILGINQIVFNAFADLFVKIKKQILFAFLSRVSRVNLSLA